MTTGTSRPTALATPNPLAFATALPTALPQQNALTVARDIRTELEAARRVSSVANDGFAAIALGRPGFGQTTAQKIKQRLDGDTLFGTGFFGVCGGAFAGLGANAGVPYFGLGTATEGMWLGWAVFGVGCAIAGAAIALSKIAGKVGARQATQRIELNDVEGVVTKLETGTPFEKAVASKQIAKWRNALDYREALTPETRERLDTTQTALCPENPVEDHRAAALSEIADIIDGRDHLSAHNVHQLGSSILKLDPADQHDVAVVAAQSIRNSSRVKDYKAEHEAYALPKKFPPATTAGPAEART